VRSFGTGGGRFYEDVHIVDGPRTRATIQRADLKDNPQVEFAYPKIACRVLARSLLKPGQVVLLKGGEHYLTTDHSATGDYRVLHLFLTDRQVVWSRKAVTTDILTGLAKATPGDPDPIGNPIWVMWERVRRQFPDTAAHMNVDNNLIATGYPVQLNDFIDGKVVKRVDQALGVWIVEVQA
jgi:hypothetical protein